MEEKLLKLFKLADSLNEKQDKLFADIEYCANDTKKLIISIRDKETYRYIERCEMEFSYNHPRKWDNIIKVFENYIGGASNEQERSN